MDIITGYTGTPHITAENDRDINIGIFGSKSYVLQTGTMLTAEISNNNEIKVRDGVIMHQGCAASIKKNTYDSVTINNGSQGMKRIDLIVARYEKQPETNVESLTLKVLQGTPTETSPQVPAHTEGDIQAGDTVADMPLYEVEIDGLNITEIRKVFQTMGDLESVNGNIGRYYVKNNNNYINIKADVDTNLVTMELPAGTYVIKGEVHFQSLSEKISRYAVTLKHDNSTVDTNIASLTVYLAQSWYTEIPISGIVSSDTNIIVKLNCSQTIANTAKGFLRAVRINS